MRAGTLSGIASPRLPSSIISATRSANRVGAWRLLEAMRATEVPATALVNSRIYEAAPGLVEAWREAGFGAVAWVLMRASRRR